MLDNKWLTIEQASELTGYTGGYLRRLLRDQVLPGVNVNTRMWMIRLEDAEKLAQKPHVNGRPRSNTPQNISKKAKSKKS